MEKINNDEEERKRHTGKIALFRSRPKLRGKVLRSEGFGGYIGNINNLEGIFYRGKIWGHISQKPTIEDPWTSLTNHLCVPTKNPETRRWALTFPSMHKKLDENFLHTHDIFYNWTKFQIKFYWTTYFLCFKRRTSKHQFGRDVKVGLCVTFYIFSLRQSIDFQRNLWQYTIP